MDEQEESCGYLNLFSHNLHDVFETSSEGICNVKPTEGANCSIPGFRIVIKAFLSKMA